MVKRKKTSAIAEIEYCNFGEKSADSQLAAEEESCCQHNKREAQLLVNCRVVDIKCIGPFLTHSYAKSNEENACPVTAKTSLLWIL